MDKRNILKIIGVLLCLSILSFLAFKFYSKGGDGAGLVKESEGVLAKTLEIKQILKVQLKKLPKKIIFEKSSVVKAPVETKELPKKDLKRVSYKDNVERKVQFQAIKKIQLSPGRDYEEGIFYVEDERIARQKIVDGNIVEQTGNIPDGRIRFYNEDKQTYGEEFYKDGKIEGDVLTYNNNGTLRKEAKYVSGSLRAIKEYFPNGQLKFEADYSDALNLDGEKEVGVGKIYFANGNLKYHWNLTFNLMVGFKKGYDQNGELTSELYFNQRGELIEKRL